MTRPQSRPPTTDQGSEIQDGKSRHGTGATGGSRPGPAERLKRDGSTGPLRGGSAEARELFEQVAAETEMPCRATFMDDPLFGGRAARVTGMTPEGGLITDSGADADQVPVLLFEPVHTIAMKDPVTGLSHEPRIDTLVGAGWQRVPPRFVMAGLPADGWGLYRTATGVELVDPYGCVYAEGRLTLDPEWVSAAVSTGAVMVFIGPNLGIRVPPGRSPESYTDGDRIREFRYGRENGLLAAATVRWHTSPPGETATWVLLREDELGPACPPVAYVPRLNLKAHGGPQAFGFASLDRLGPRAHGDPGRTRPGRPDHRRRRGPHPPRRRNRRLHRRLPQSQRAGR